MMVSQGLRASIKQTCCDVLWQYPFCRPGQSRATGGRASCSPAQTAEDLLLRLLRSSWECKALMHCVQKGVVDTQLIAHDKEVYDIAWGGVGVFASVSADGSVRIFDLR